jgi:putative ABC transport system substrate-binding protein
VFNSAFVEGLNELGYVPDKNIVLITRFSGGEDARLKQNVVDLIALKVDVLFLTEKAVPIAKKLTSKIPIVAPNFFDPVGEGLVSSLPPPGGNITGISWQSADASGKRLQLATDLVVGLKRVAILVDPRDSGSVIEAKAFREAAGRASIQVREILVHDDADFESALASLKADRPHALIASDFAVITMRRERLSRFALQNQLPFITESRHWAEAGALMSYGASSTEMFRRSAYYVDRILRGARPGDLPIEQPTKFELVINLRAAKAIGINVPERLLIQADEVIR